MTGKEKLIQYIDFKGISKSDFYRKTGFSNGFLDSGKHIGSDNLKVIISAFPDLSLEWLVMDEGEMIKNSSVSPPPQDNEERIALYKELIISKDKEIESKQEIIDFLNDHINTLKNMPVLGSPAANVG